MKPAPHKVNKSRQNDVRAASVVKSKVLQFACQCDAAWFQGRRWWWWWGERGLGVGGGLGRRRTLLQLADNALRSALSVYPLT